jgi:hypothetical protein
VHADAAAAAEAEIQRLHHRNRRVEEALDKAEVDTKCLILKIKTLNPKP